MSLEIFFIVIIAIIQIAIFILVVYKTLAFRYLFPSDLSRLTVRTIYIDKDTLSNSKDFDKYLENLSIYTDSGSASSTSKEVQVLALPNNIKNRHTRFANILKDTNAYLCKNKGAVADFNILQDICEREIEKTDNDISYLISLPLYLGLAGTFIGIITGLASLAFATDMQGNSMIISMESISALLQGVVVAMAASLFGLSLMVFGGALLYRPAAFNNDGLKNNYFNFLQRELLPYMNTSFSQSLSSFKDVLNFFVSKFTTNMDDYKNAGDRLTNNLKQQHLVLEEINKLNLVQTSTSVANLFGQLKESSEHLEKFVEYQRGLDSYINNTKNVTQEMHGIINNFKDFVSNLKHIGQHTSSSIELQQQLKSSLETHFPTIQDHREVWREHVDELNSDVKDVYAELNNYFIQSSEQIKSFIEKNHALFSSTDDIKALMNTLISTTTNLQKEFISTSKLTTEAMKAITSSVIEKETEIKVIEQAILDIKKDSKELKEAYIASNKELKEAYIASNKESKEVLSSK